MTYNFTDVSKGYVIRLPYDEATGNATIVSVVPTTESDMAFLEQNKDNILHIEPREENEHIIDFKMRVESTAEEKRQELKNPNHFN